MITTKRHSDRDMTTSNETGSRVVRHYSNGQGSTWTSCLWVNYGETITPIRGTHKTEKGAIAWARKQLSK